MINKICKCINSVLACYENDRHSTEHIRLISNGPVQCQMFNPSEDNTVRITGWMPVIHDGPVHSADIDIPDLSEPGKYHGISPAFSAPLIRKMIQNGAFRNLATITSVLSHHTEHYCWIFPGKKPVDCKGLEEMFIYTIFRMASHFGYRFRIEDDETFRKLTDIIESDESNTFVSGITFSLCKDALTIIGGPADEILKKLSGFHLTPKGVITTKSEENSCPFNSFYENAALPVLLYDYVYYNGVIARLMHIREIPEACQLLVGQTTFATLDAFDKGNTISHPLLRGRIQGSTVCIADTIKHIRLEEHKKMSDVFISTSPTINQINAYLAQSLNSNTIAVSAILTTSDGFIIGATRNSNTIDSGTCYCSANGQAEFADPFVQLEESPTLTTDSLHDLSAEAEREAMAELGVSCFRDSWTELGLSVLGIIGKVTDGTGPTRLHFNVLFSNLLTDNFKTVENCHKNGSESFENSQLIAISPAQRYQNNSCLENEFYNVLVNLEKQLKHTKPHSILLITYLSYLAKQEPDGST